MSVSNTTRVYVGRKGNHRLTRNMYGVNTICGKQYTLL